jgi:hypothetical protein
VPPDPDGHEDVDAQAGQADEVPKPVHLVCVELIFVQIYEKGCPFPMARPGVNVMITIFGDF